MPRGQEKLRIAPTPNHSLEMIDKFVKDLSAVWTKLGLPKRSDKCTEECTFCKKPLLFDQLEAREKWLPDCDKPYCPGAAAAYLEPQIAEC